MNELLDFKMFEIDDGETFWYIGKNEDDVLKLYLDEMEPDPEYDIDIKQVSLGRIHGMNYISERLIDCDLYKIQKLNKNVEKDNGVYYEYPMSVEVLTKIATHHAKKALEVEVSNAYFIAMTGCY